MPIKEIEGLQHNSEEAQVKAAISACIAEEMRRGRSRAQAVAMCYAMAKEKTGEELAPREESL